MLNPYVGMMLPAAGPIAVVSKLPANWKTMFFKLPVWATSSVIAWKLGHMFTGVLAPYAMITLELILFPSFLLLKSLHDRKQRKKELIC